MDQFRAAQPSNESDAVLVEQLDTTLRATANDVYAGMTRSDDGAIQLHLTARPPEIEATIERIVSGVRETHPDGWSMPDVERIVGTRNSLRTLEDLRDRITARHRALKARGILITSWGVDVWKNRVRMEVRDLTPQARAFLEAEFGPDTVDVVATAGWWAHTMPQQGSDG